MLKVIVVLVVIGIGFFACAGDEVVSNHNSVFQSRLSNIDNL